MFKQLNMHHTEQIEDEKELLISKSEISWGMRIGFSLIISFDIFIIVMVLSIIFGWQNIIHKLLVICVFVFIILLIYFTLRKHSKSILIATVLNTTPLYPIGFYYSTEKVLPGLNISEIFFFICHFIFYIIDPLVTLVSTSAQYYPIKEGDKFVFL